MARELPRPFQGRSDKVVKKPNITARLPSDAKKQDLDFDSSFRVIIFAPHEGKQGWRSRKPILTGPCTIVENASGDRTLKFDLETIYDNVSASPRADSLTVSGGISEGPGRHNVHDHRVLQNLLAARVPEPRAEPSMPLRLTAALECLSRRS